MLTDTPHRRAEVLPRRVVLFVEDVAEEIASVHPDEHGLRGVADASVPVALPHATHGEREMRHRVDRALIGDEVEASLGGFDRRALDLVLPFREPTKEILRVELIEGASAFASSSCQSC